MLKPSKTEFTFQMRDINPVSGEVHRQVNVTTQSAYTFGELRDVFLDFLHGCGYRIELDEFGDVKDHDLPKELQ